MVQCECGCGEEAKQGKFLSGHDQRLRISIERRVGGLLALRSLVEAADGFASGDVSAQAFKETVRSLFNSADPR